MATPPELMSADAIHRRVHADGPQAPGRRVSGFDQHGSGNQSRMKIFTPVARSTLAMAAGLGLAGLGIAPAAQAQPAPFPVYHWCPGQQWDPGWGNNWDWGRCHDDNWYDGDPHDGGHWHGPGGYPGGPGGPASYHWCPGQQWDPGWGNNWDWGRCHDEHYYDGDPRDQGHWH